MNTTYKYEFVTEAVEVEISEAWAEVLIMYDREEYNANKKETRRHLKLDASMEGSDWLKDEKADPGCIVEELDMEESLMNQISKILTDKQFNAFEKICINRYTEDEYAKMMGITQQAAHKHVSRAKDIISEYLKNNLNTIFF